MHPLLKYGLGFVIAAAVLAFGGALLAAVLSLLLRAPFFSLVEKIGIGFFMLSVLLMILGKKVRGQVSANIVEKAKGRSLPVRALYHLLMSYDGVFLTAAAGLVLLLIPLVF